MVDNGEDKILAHFNETASSYDDLARRIDASQDVMVKYVKRYFQSGQHVLDIACGTGLASAPLAEQGTVIYGIDGSEHMLAEYAKKGVTRELKQQDLQKNPLLPYPSEMFDHVLSNGFFYFVKDFSTLVAEAHRVLRPEGRLYFNFEEVHGEDGVDFIVMDGSCVSKQVLDAKGTYVYFHERRDVETLLTAQGFYNIFLERKYVHDSPSTGRPVHFTYVVAEKR